MLTPIIYNTPLPSDYFKDIYSQLRGIKESFRERFELEHYIGESENPADYNCDGYHKYLILTPLITDPEGDAIYAKQTGTTIIPYLKRGSNIKPLVSVVIFGISNVEYELDPFTFKVQQSKTVDYYVSPVLGDRTEGSCWNTTGDPEYADQGIMPEDTVIYMRYYKRLLNNSYVYSRNQLVFKLIPDGWNYYPSESGWLPAFNPNIANSGWAFIISQDVKELRFYIFQGGGAPSYSNSINLTDEQWTAAGTIDGMTFSSVIKFYRGVQNYTNASKTAYQTRVSAKKLKVEYQ